MEKQSTNESNRNLNHLKEEFKKETGVDISQYGDMNKGSLTSRQNGYVGGYIGGTMTKKLVEMAEQQLTEDQYQNQH